MCDPRNNHQIYCTYRHAEAEQEHNFPWHVSKGKHFLGFFPAASLQKDLINVFHEEARKLSHH
jgi:hypothetical protein